MNGGPPNRDVASFISSGTDSTRVKLLFDKSQSTSRINIEMSDIQGEAENPPYQFTLQKEEGGVVKQIDQKVEINSKESRESRGRLSFGKNYPAEKLDVNSLKNENFISDSYANSNNRYQNNNINNKEHQYLDIKNHSSSNSNENHRRKKPYNINDQMQDINNLESNKVLNESEPVVEDEHSDDSEARREKVFKLVNFFYDINQQSEEENLTYHNLEEQLISEYTMIQAEYKMLSTDQKVPLKQNEEEVRLKLKVGMEFLDSSVLKTEPQDGKEKNNSPSNSFINNCINDVAVSSTFRNQKQKDYYENRLYYYEKIIEVLMKKYKPLIFNDEGFVEIKRRSTLLKRSVHQREHKDKNNPNQINSKSEQDNFLFHLKQDENYMKFNYDMREMDKKIMDSVANIKFGDNQTINQEMKTLNKQNNLNDAKTLQNSEIHKSFDDMKEIKILNKDNTLLKIILYKIYKYPYHYTHYVQWKSYLLNLISRWRYQEEVQTTSPKKMKIKYLKTKFLIEKLIQNKQTRRLGKLINLEAFSHKLKTMAENSSNRKVGSITHKHEEKPFNEKFLHIFFGLFNKFLPIMTYAYDTNFMIVFDFLVDFQILYFLFLSPVIVVIEIDMNSFITPITMFFHTIYCFDILRKFRRLKYTETHVVETNLGKLFRNNIFDLNIFFSLSTLIPYISFYPNITPLQVSSMYSILFFIPIFRLVDFGKSMEYLEKTKYAVFCRLALLIIRFFSLAHWMGLLFMKFVNFDYTDPTYFLEADCQQLTEGQITLTQTCKYIISLMDGTYLIPGGFISNLNPSTTSDYIFIFVSYFIGQIIVAYVFGGVTSLIANLNQAAKIYREKLDTIKSFMLFYSFSTDIKNDINIYYEYLWLKKRNMIYDSTLLANLSQSLIVKISHEVYPHQRFFLKDFYGLSKNKEKRLISTLICNLKEYIAFPLERIYTQGEMIRGLFILTDGTAIFTDRTNKDGQNFDDALFNMHQDDLNINNANKAADSIRYDFNHKVTVDRQGYFERMEFNRVNNIKDDWNGEKTVLKNPNQTLMPLDSIFLKTGRGIETCYVDDFADFFIVDINFFDEKLCVNFPTEMQILKESGMRMGLAKIGENTRIQNLVFKHSSRSVGPMYEEEYNLNNIWIEIKHKIPTIINQEIVKNEQDEDQPFNLNAAGLFEFGFGSIFSG